MTENHILTKRKLSASADEAETYSNSLEGTKVKKIKESVDGVGGNKETDDNNQGFISVYAQRKGEREEMQDRHIILTNFNVPIKDIKRSAFFALFDGHGGKSASDFCEKNFPSQLLNSFNKYCTNSTASTDFKSAERSMKKIFVESYKIIDDGFLSEARATKPPLKDGSTACTTLLIDNFIYSANVGDTKAIVCRYKKESKELTAMPLTTEHNPQNFDERMRIQKAGGIVRDGRVMGILEVARSIGDGPMKAHGVICTPDIKKLTLTENDLFLLIGCDGLWKIFTSNTAINFIVEKYKNQMAKYEDEESLWIKVSDDLVSEAVLRGSGDNVSVVLVIFNNFRNVLQL